MRRGLAILATLLVAGYVLYELRQSQRDELNRRSIERIFSGQGRPGGDVGERPPADDGSNRVRQRWDATQGDP